MPITVEWHGKSQTLIATRFEDPWSLEDFIEARKAWHRMIKSVDHRVPIFLDLQASQRPPAGILRHFSAIHRTPHPRQGHLYIAGLNGAMERLRPHLFAGATDPSKEARLVDSIESILLPG